MSSIRLKHEELIAEFVGTFAVVFIGCLAEVKENDPVTTGFCLFMAYAFFSYAGMRFSKAHLNPAISVAYLIAGDLTPLKLAFYVAAQTAASFLAGFLMVFFTNQSSKSLGEPRLFRIAGSDSLAIQPIQGSRR